MNLFYLNNQLKMSDIQVNCPCGGGQSCIVHRRMLGDFVIEDMIFDSHQLPKRTNCDEPYSNDQKVALHNTFQGTNSIILSH